MRKTLRFGALLLASLLSTAAMVSCGQTGQNENSITSNTVTSEDTTQEITGTVRRENGDIVPITKLSQVAQKNENFLDTEVSWYDDDYNYYVYNVGKIKNVPLTSTYTTFIYNGGNFKKEHEVTKATETTMQVSTSKAITSSVSTTVSGSINVTKGLSANIKGVLDASVERGFSISISNTTTHETEWKQTYQSGASESKKESDKISLTFDSSCKHGNYLYLYL